MSRSTSINIKHCCIVCFREYSPARSPGKEVRQPDNPRKVFKVCSSYLKPEVFTKYSKWDLLTDAERQAPFCSMCCKSGEKLSAMNDKLEEIQREIKSFLKYFVKEIRLCRENEENEESELDEGQHLIPGNIPLGEERPESLQISVNRDTNHAAQYSTFIKQEIQEESCFVSDVEYCPSGEEENDDENDDNYVPRKSARRCGSESKKVGDSTIHRSCIKWREIQITSAEVEENWSYLYKGNNRKSKRITTDYYYCKEGGQRNCPARLKRKQTAGKPGFQHYVNGESHHHVKRSFGVSRNIKREIQRIYEEDPDNAKPAFIMEILESKGMEIQKVQLNNLLNRYRKVRMERLGLVPPKEEGEKNVSLPSQNRKRGRPPGAINKYTTCISRTASHSHTGNDKGEKLAKLESDITSHPQQEHTDTYGHGPQIQPTVIMKSIVSEGENAVFFANSQLNMTSRD